MNADQILDSLRPLVLVVDRIGTILDLRGGFGGFFGHDLDTLAGTSVFDFVAADNVDELATYFLESEEQSLETVSLPLPFRVALFDADGVANPVDVIPTGEVHDGELQWVVLVVPVDLHTSVSRSLEAEMTGASRERVKEILTEELAVENRHYSTRWFLVDLMDTPGRLVTTSRSEDRPMAKAIEQSVTAGGWSPWAGVSQGRTEPLSVGSLPEPLQELAADRLWRRVSVTPVYVDGRLAAAYLLFGRVPADYAVMQINSNVLARIDRLVDATSLLIARWHDRDRLVTAATSDPLTGLANRDAFADALARAGEEATLLYIDVDHFKTVNDHHGHDMGDRVLVEIARRIVQACRPGDVVARFGGDEFVVLLDGVALHKAHVISERIIELVGAPMPEAEALDQITISVGMAPLVSRNDVVSAADRAMLQAKRNGRARVVTADVPRFEPRRASDG